MKHTLEIQSSQRCKEILTELLICCFITKRWNINKVIKKYIDIVYLTIRSQSVPNVRTFLSKGNPSCQWTVAKLLKCFVSTIKKILRKILILKYLSLKKQKHNGFSVLTPYYRMQKILQNSLWKTHKKVVHCQYLWRFCVFSWL